MLKTTSSAVDTAVTRQALQQAAARLAVSLSEQQVSDLLAYLNLIVKWNKVYNLTAVRDPAEMLTHHLLDSLAIVAPLNRHILQHTSGTAINLLDVGAGAGLPGVVVAICCPQVAVTCVDAVAKKMAFVQQVATELKLSNLKALHSRVEVLSQKFEVITSRAFATLADFVAGSQAALAPDSGVWLAMKGRDPSAEVAALPAEVTVFHVEQLTVPGLDAERCIVWMKKAISTG
ncbi:MAG: 16S rRNA (guanine(527)-N(7))-methyltransferase RsmG [Burkholderiaceae bacterium]|nr:16S rRNA (guanine(527)-N(7))-methyltransferase RsmG [Burkholderiaceae bacterium]